MASSAIGELRQHRALLAKQYPSIEDLALVGIDLTVRGLDTKTVKKKIEAGKAAEKATKPESRAKKRSALGRSNSPGMA